MSRLLTNTFLFLIIVFLLNSCLEEYSPEVSEYENMMVVDGGISNHPGPYTIVLSLSSPLYYPKLEPYHGAWIAVADDLGNEEVFTETEPGVYKSAADGLQGTIGRKYKIKILTSDNKEYQSTYQELKKPVEIENIYSEIYARQTNDDYRPEYGYQFYVNSKTTDDDSTYLMWRAKGTYKFTSDFLIRYIYTRRSLKTFPKPDSLYTCFAEDINTGLYTLDMSKLSTPQVVQFPLNKVNTETRKLAIRYSLLVNQFTIGVEAYDYFNRQIETNTQQGGLYSTLPYQVNGNVHNILDDSESLLGYFLVASVDEKRIFVDRPPSSQVKFYYGECIIGEADYDAYSYISMTPSNSWPIYVTTDANNRRALTNQSCVDCRKKGGNLNTPDFWVD